MENIPEPKLGLIVCSRDCFPAQLSKKRREDVVRSCRENHVPLVELSTILESEEGVLKALAEAAHSGIDALVIYLGNFGPEGPITLLAQKFDGPVMIVAAAEETGKDLIGGRGDAYCGLLNVSYNTGLRDLKPYIPEYPVGTPMEIMQRVRDFIPIARILLGLKNLKIFSFGPRPQDFLACNAPIKPLFSLGVEIMENSELDLYDLFLSAEGDPGIDAIAGDMAGELGSGNSYPELLVKLAQYEVALLKFMKGKLGASRFGIFANKCWPAFEKYFGFVPCYVNSRLAARGIPVSCEVDIYGALSEYIAACASGLPPTLLDINNTVPADMIAANSAAADAFKPTDLFMGFHCGNTPGSCLLNPSLKHQLIMHRLMEPDREPDITRGTLEGRIRPGEITLFRLQSTADTHLKSYVAQGKVLDIDPRSFGGIGVFAVPEMGRFYRHVLIEKKFPHHTAVAFRHVGKTLFETMKILGIEDNSFNLPPEIPYANENPFK